MQLSLCGTCFTTNSTEKMSLKMLSVYIMYKEKYEHLWNSVWTQRTHMLQAWNYWLPYGPNRPAVEPANPHTRLAHRYDLMAQNSFTSQCCYLDPLSSNDVHARHYLSIPKLLHAGITCLSQTMCSIFQYLNILAPQCFYLRYLCLLNTLFLVCRTLTWPWVRV